MKKIFSLLLLFLLFMYSESLASFYAKRIGSWETYPNGQILKLESKIGVYGLLYQESINLKLKLGSTQQYNYNTGNYDCINPPTGKYEFIWNFYLPKEAIIKNLQVLDNKTGVFIKAAVLDLSTGETKYDPNSSTGPNVLLKQLMRRDYDGNYNLQYELRISQINWDESVEFIIDYVSPCTMVFDKRLVVNNAYQFNTSAYYNCYTNAPTTFIALDYNNPDSPPNYYSGVQLQWEKNNSFWQATRINNVAFTISFLSESSNGKFLKTYADSDLKFYQLATKPQIPDELRYARKIIVACDLTASDYSSFKRTNFIDMLKQTLSISTTEKDSLVFVTSDFNVKWLNSSFLPRTESFINTQLDLVNQIIPKLNTLPYMLKDIVQFLNNKKTDAEVWIVSDDYKTGVRAETVMDLLNQTYFTAKNKIVFNILDASQAYNGYYIQNKYYKGNEYLYENLTRLSGGNFGKLYNKYYLNYIDEALDCWAPNVSTVEIDPTPAFGFTHSRVNLNKGRNNFNITSRYYQIGILSGILPLEVNYYGNYLSKSYFNNIKMTEDNISVFDSLKENTCLYWYGNYIMNDLFLQPQSFSTIKYIEDLSTRKHLLTPYCAFVIPTPDGYSGYKRSYEDELVLSVNGENKEDKKPLPTQISMSSYPNPFNPTTTICLKLTSEVITKEKKLDIYNIIGQKIKSFDLTSYQNLGEIIVKWDGFNDHGSEVSSGIYFAVFTTNNVVKSLKLQLIR